ncbi:DUF6056 family protein [Chryseobacterium lactis]|uniref:DUF6056 family protein n=1 Tax=Chryseobacterium lactis TaxID=1241981 RepID=UPI001629F3E6|nr:hypothetical protein [Chryseobacterium lactis]
MKTVQNIVLFLSVILCIGLVYISMFNVYQTDDYMCAYGTRVEGLWGNFTHTYLYWGGRYFGYTVNMLNPVAYDINGIFPKVYPIFLMLSFIGVAALNFKAYFSYSPGEALKKSLMLFFFYTILLVSIPEHYFWITGSNIYFLPVILSGLLLYFFKKNEDTAKKIWFYLSLLLIVVLMGANEILALLLQGLLMVSYYQKRNKQNLIFLLTGTVFLLVSFLAPGNFNRMGETEDGLLKWLKRVAVFGANTAYIAFKSLLVLPIFIKVFEKELKKNTQKITFQKAVSVWAVSLLPLLFTGFILNLIARQFENIIFYFFITFAVLLVFKMEKIKQFWWVSFIIIFLPEFRVFPERYSYLNIDLNAANIATEIFTTDLAEYEREVDERIDLIRHCPKDSVVVKKVKVIPRILYFDEMASVNENETYVNDQLQKYFEKKYIRTK